MCGDVLRGEDDVFASCPVQGASPTDPHRRVEDARQRLDIEVGLHAADAVCEQEQGVGRDVGVGDRRVLVGGDEAEGNGEFVEVPRRHSRACRERLGVEDADRREGLSEAGELRVQHQCVEQCIVPGEQHRLAISCREPVDDDGRDGGEGRGSGSPQRLDGDAVNLAGPDALQPWRGDEAGEPAEDAASLNLGERD